MVVLIVIAIAIFLWWSLVPSKKNKTNYYSPSNNYGDPNIDLRGVLFLEKYKCLIDAFRDHPDAKVIECTKDSFRTSLSSNGAVTSFFLLESFGHYNVIWEHRSPMFGKNVLKWQFDVNHSPYLALEKIRVELGEYEQKMFQRRWG
ncbi:hypothetical protein [Myroides odoratus]|uniref:hypothetical protein n=1 Tax=Myroides odoratus TaxID=256 RepID=UPI00333EFBD2